MREGESGGGAVSTGPATGAVEVGRGAVAALGLLFAMNLLDAANRSVLAAVLPQAQGALRFDDERAGMLAFWWLLSFMLVALCVGYFGDRVRRPWLLALGSFCCAAGAAGSGVAGSYGALRAARVVFGVGGGLSGVVALTMLADLFPRTARARVMAWFYLALPVGGALGLWLGGALGARWGWRAAFLAAAAPAVPLALAALWLRDPVRGQSEGVRVDRLRDHERAGPSREDYIDLMVNSSYTYSVLGMAFYTFAMGGLVYWLPKFLQVVKDVPQAQATAMLALIALPAAVLGMAAGGWMADRLVAGRPSALFLVPGLAMLTAVPLVLVAVYASGRPAVYAALFVAQASMFLIVGPCNAVIANVVMPNMRASAFAVALFAVHLLGDLWSPTLMGWVADTFGRHDAMESVFGQALTVIGAVPSRRADAPPENLKAAMLVVLPALLLSGAVLLSGARHLPREMALMLAKLKASPRR